MVGSLVGGSFYAKTRQTATLLAG